MICVYCIPAGIIINEACDYDNIEDDQVNPSAGAYYSEVGLPNEYSSTPVPPELPYETPVSTLEKVLHGLCNSFA